MAWMELWRSARVVENRAVARGTQLTSFVLPDDLPFPFEPGHVVVLRLHTPSGLHRHPYTVCGADASRRQLTFVYRVIPEGRLTPTFASLPMGAEAELSGLHHTPIREEVDPGAGVIVGLATSSGLGPLWGYAASAVAQGEKRPIHLIVGVREEADLLLQPELEALQAFSPSFHWTPIVSRPTGTWTGLRGRLTDHAPTFLPDLQDAHVHLVGNMAMVKTMEAALHAAGLPAYRVTKEGFFNWNAEPDPVVIADLAQRLSRF
jgi:NAD(P)H-flavin reductase